MKVLFLDTETYSSLPLSGTAGVGAERYSEAPDAAVTLLAYAEDDGEVRVLEEWGTLTSELFEWERVIGMLTDPGALKVAHNARFDRTVLSRMLYGPGDRFLPPEQWADTMHIAARLGLPRSLAALSEALGAPPKDEAGTALLNRFAKPWPATKTRRAGRIWPHQEPKRWEDFRRYAAADVEALRGIWNALLTDPLAANALRRCTLATDPLDERAVELLSERINDRGMPVNERLLTTMLGAEQRNAERIAARLRELTGLDNPASTVQLMGWLATRANVVDLRRETLERELESKATSLTDETREVLALRIALARAAGRKLIAAQNRTCTDGRIRGALQYLGAHTGRWAGRGFQPQNLPRETLPDGVTLADVVARAERGEDVDPKEVAASVRSVIAGPLIVCDFSSIEAIVLAWFAGERWVMQAYGAGRDLYAETAERMSEILRRPMSRHEGKTAVLGCGYGAGVTGLRAFAGDGPSDQELQSIVNAWRRANPHTVQLWRQLETEMRLGGGHFSGGVFPDGFTWRQLHLPSGRALTYRGWLRDGQGDMRFWDPQRKIQVSTWGGRLTENLVQAIARDVLADAMLRLDEAGWRIVAHVHDEVVIESGPDDPPWWDDVLGVPTAEGVAAFREVRRIMETPPSWAPDLHVRAAGGVVDAYRKLGKGEEIQ